MGEKWASYVDEKDLMEMTCRNYCITIYITR
jgi:hypothetical protein